MTKLYHAVPAPMDGSIIYPLNELRRRSPELYELHARKYTGRERLMQKVIPPLDCLWNDVIFLTAVHPKTLQRALIEAGGPVLQRSYFEIDSAQLDPALTTVFLYTKTKVHEAFSDEDFAPLDAKTTAKCSVILPETKAYYVKMYAAGQRPLLYHLTPHILYRSTIETKDLPVITL